MGLIRHILTTAGGALVAKGAIDETGKEAIIGGLIAVAGVIWSVWSKKQPPATGVPGRPLSLLLAGSLLFTGCSTLDPATGKKAYDPVKTEHVKASIQAPVQEVITRIIRNSPEHSSEIASYFNSFRSVFCKMRDTGRFDSAYLLAEVDRTTMGLQSGLDPLVTTTKNTIVVLYTLFYSQRTVANLPQDKFMWNVSDLFCNAIGSGLADAGFVYR